MKIVRTDAELFLPTLDHVLRTEGHEVVLLPDGIAEDDLAAAVSDADIILMCYTPVTRRVIAAAPKLRGIVKYGTGIDAIDISAAKERGVVVVNVPAYAENTVAEGAFLLMLSLLRKLPSLSATMQSEGWTWPEPRWLGRDLAGLTVGLVGFGRIGQAFARMAGPGFGAKVLAYDPHKPDEVFRAAGVMRAETLHGLLARSDVVSVHAVLTPDSRHMIGDAEFRAMKPGTILINVSRGALIDEQALIRALDSGQLGGAGLDVYSEEPLALRGHPLSPLFGRTNVILMPHLTFWTHEALTRLEAETKARIDELIAGRPVTIRSADPRLSGQAAAVYPF